MKTPDLALGYHPEAYATDTRRLMGRHAAGEAWLRAFALDPPADGLICAAESRAPFAAFARQAWALSGR